jgi:hypothetical protein
MDIVADSAGGLGGTPAGLQDCLRSMLIAFERSVGFAEGVVMSFDPEVLLPNAFAASVERGLDDAVLACRNEQLDRDFLKFRDLATSRVPVGVASRETDPRARSSPRWREILDVRGHGHELRAALVDASGQCWGALNFMREAGHPFGERDVRLVQRGIGRGAFGIRGPLRPDGPPGRADVASPAPDMRLTWWAVLDLNQWPLPCQACLIRLPRSLDISLPQLNMTALSWRVALRLVMPGAVVTWLVTGPRRSQRAVGGVQPSAEANVRAFSRSRIEAFRPPSPKFPSRLLLVNSGVGAGEPA